MALLDDSYRANISVELESDEVEVELERRVPGGRMLAAWILLVVWAGVVTAIARTPGGDAESNDWAVREGTVSDLQLLRNAGEVVAERSMRQELTLTITPEHDAAGAEPVELALSVASDGAGAAEAVYETATASVPIVFHRDHVYLPAVHGEGWIGYQLTDFQDVITAQEQLLGSGVLSYLDQLAGPEQILVMGVEEVGGVVATHYRAVVAFSFMLGTTEVLTGSSVPMEPSELEDDLPDVELDIWLDGLGVPRQVRYTQNLGGGTITVDQITTEVGRPIEIHVPGPDEVAAVFPSTSTDPNDPFPVHLSQLLQLPATTTP